MIKTTRWRSCKNTPPKKDGEYLVVRFRKDGTMSYASHLGYTTKYGWNTYKESYDNAITDFKDELWTEMTKTKGRK